jgi:hypothetical protein
MGPLIKLLLPPLCAAASTLDEAQAQITELLHKVAICKPELQAVGEELLIQGSKLQQHQQQTEADGGEDEGSAAGLGRLQRLLQVLDARHPEELDGAINTVLRASRQQGEGEGEGHGEVSVEAVFAFVQSCFRGSKHDVVGAGAAALTLAVAVNAPADELRLMVRGLGESLGVLEADGGWVAFLMDGGGQGDATLIVLVVSGVFSSSLSVSAKFLMDLPSCFWI